MVGNVLRILRFINGNLTLEAVSKNTFVTPSRLSLYENNDKNPSEEMLSRLANFYHISSEKIIELSLIGEKYNLNLLELTYLIAKEYNAPKRILLKKEQLIK